MAEPGRAGLAANQIGSGLAVFSYNVDGELGYVINPEVMELRDSLDGPEACLSIPGITAIRSRAAYAVVEGSTSPGAGRRLRTPANWPAACSTKPTTCAASSTSTASPARSAAASCGTSPRPRSLGDDLPSLSVYPGRLPSKMCLICVDVTNETERGRTARPVPRRDLGLGWRGSRSHPGHGRRRSTTRMSTTHTTRP